MGRTRDESSGSLFPEAAPGARSGSDEEPRPDAPLADRVRPRTLEEVLGQDEVLGPGRPLRRAIEQDQLRSLILWGPPGSGKTTLALLLARISKSSFLNKNFLLLIGLFMKPIVGRRASRCRHLARKNP